MEELFMLFARFLHLPWDFLLGVHIVKFSRRALYGGRSDQRDNVLRTRLAGSLRQNNAGAGSSSVTHVSGDKSVGRESAFINIFVGSFSSIVQLTPGGPQMRQVMDCPR